MAISTLAKKKLLKRNYTAMAGKEIEHITIHHCAVVNATAEGMYNAFNNEMRAASANYFIDSDGGIYCFVDELHRAWTSGTVLNDGRAITIEVSNNAGAEKDWSISEQAFAALIDLCTDICKRYNLTAYFDDTANATFNLHRHFQATQCPGAYIYNNMKQITQLVNARLLQEYDNSYVKTCEYINKVCFLETGSQEWKCATFDEHMNAFIIDTQFELSAIAIQCSKGNCVYKVHTKEYGWLPDVYSSNYNLSDSDKGYAGLEDSTIDAITICYLTDTQEESDYIYAKYFVRLKEMQIELPEQLDDVIEANNEGYAGIINYTIDKLYLYLSK